MQCSQLSHTSSVAGLSSVLFSSPIDESVYPTVKAVFSGPAGDAGGLDLISGSKVPNGRQTQPSKSVHRGAATPVCSYRMYFTEVCRPRTERLCLAIVYYYSSIFGALRMAASFRSLPSLTVSILTTHCVPRAQHLREKRVDVRNQR
ncbi:hypothetical protein BAUCODRAFT_394556 [Baudoinia panamericana UAMH 10762]|uniref:Uncharacterized protein n=1 Tax=Baudoinia panamericana (strain UAMH 10762) TaxID=717646 RepID=M2MQU6_BAUPA|nr:uncharacterized protein BAUCODRAFT_394556 [Baudoinia panamericana UAMH 10762]EMC99196.1 hypothetical protein BAUCODRAFT_394556 [Baudoinia panamericana UAMH 10762]